ncbi:MAG TPA: AgmX/PglI C-terminal domain-containing protein [Polyangiaceae bacterium]|nr:AgmX/PglI C-terminal domain-containing protein [Polyangiaceae bacterium]
MKTIGIAILGLCAGLAGCSFAARSPEMYRDETAALLETKSAQVKACYDETLKTNKDAQGRVTVRFVVEHETGKLTSVAADPAGTTAPEPLTKCVVDALQGLALSPPDQRDGNATFVYEFTQGQPGGAPAPAPAG